MMAKLPIIFEHLEDGETIEDRVLDKEGQESHIQGSQMHSHDLLDTSSTQNVSVPNTASHITLDSGCAQAPAFQYPPFNRAAISSTSTRQPNTNSNCQESSELTNG